MAPRGATREPTTPPRLHARGEYIGDTVASVRARDQRREYSRDGSTAPSPRALGARGFLAKRWGGELARGQGTPLSARHRRPRARPTLPSRDRDRLGRHSTRVTLTRSLSLALS